MPVIANCMAFYCNSFFKDVQNLSLATLYIPEFVELCLFNPNRKGQHVASAEELEYDVFVNQYTEYVSKYNR
jgi:hypothetical protein